MYNEELAKSVLASIGMFQDAIWQVINAKIAIALLKLADYHLISHHPFIATLAQMKQ